jgi:polar amino acid transport system ATP-binding protein
VSVLEVTSLDVRRGGQPIVQGVSLRAERGEILALMGRSGSGKTTVLRAIAGLDTPASGTVVTEGRVGMVFQFHHLFAHLSALHNIWLAPVHVLGEPRADAERRARALIEKLGVSERADALPHELSGGEAQRVAIARALAVEPQVLLMDEPTASLDPDRRDDLAMTLVALAAEGRTLVVASHDAAFVQACGARVLVMEAGRVQ